VPVKLSILVELYNTQALGDIFLLTSAVDSKPNAPLVELSNQLQYTEHSYVVGTYFMSRS